MNTNKYILISIAMILSTFLTMEVSVYPANNLHRVTLTNNENEASLICESLESIVDDLVEKEMGKSHLPGVAIAIVRNGQVLLEKGYGWANVTERIPVSPEKSVFQLGSVSKLFTWTAVMQLVEQGKLDLHSDVNQYLYGWGQVEPAYDQPVTLEHLMTHTAGFEDRVTGIYTLDAEALGTLTEFLGANPPNRVYPPGKITSYSNYGTALAAGIVQNTSGQSFDQYVAENIFRPLDMETASFKQNSLLAMRNNMVAGYNLVNDELVAQPITYTRQVGAGGMTATAQEMSRFMLAYLGDGRFKDTEILEAATVEQMMTGRFTHHPQLMGNVHGFWEDVINQQYVLFHTGDTLSFSSMLALLPEENMGVFIAYNRVFDSSRRHLLEGIVTECLGAGNTTLSTPSSTPPSSSKPFTGVYQSIRIDTTTPARLLAFGWETAVHSSSDGLLEIDGKTYRPIGPALFQQADGPERVAFRLDNQGQATHLFFDSIPTMAYGRLKWWETSLVQTTALVVPLLIFLANLLIWIAQIFRNNRKEYGFTHWGAMGMSLLGLMIAGLAGSAMMDAASIVFGMPAALKFAMWLSSIFAILSVITAGMALSIWVRRAGSSSQRLGYTLMAISGLVFTWFLSYWNLMPL